MKKFIKITLGMLFIVVSLLIGGSAHASFVYDRTPSGNGNMPSPITVRIQGIFGVDFCDGNSSDYFIGFLNTRNGNEDQSIHLTHTPNDVVDDTFQVSLAPDTYRWARLFCTGYPGAERFLEGNPQGSANIFTIVGAPTIVTDSPLGNGSVGNFYSTTLEAASSIGPYTWSLVRGDLPGGLSMDSSGTISGTPASTGTSSFVVQAQDSVLQVVSKSFSISIFPPSTTGFAYTRTPSGNGNITSPITVRIQGVFGLDFCNSANSTYYLSFLNTRNGSEDLSASFPHDQGDVVDDIFQVSLVPDTYRWLRIFCSPLYYFFVEGNPQGSANIFTIVTPPTIITSTLSDATVGGTYSQTIQESNGTAPFVWTISAGSLPSGLSLGSSTGTISGTPTTAGAYNFTVQVTDANSQSDTQDLSIVVNAAPNITTTSLSAATVSGAYSKTLLVTGGTPSFSWSVISGSLPTGLSLSSSTGVISGTPTAAGTYNFTVQVSDSYSVTDTQALSVLVNVAPTITRNNLPDAKVNHNYSQTVTTSGGTTPLTWIISSGSLPPGLSISSSTGVISGTPTTVGTYSFTVQVTDANNVSGTKNLSIQVKP